ncbi:hypothetical protein BDR26DRAFT_934024 [Obelidium mucronatum]|nr:hypothetical protein BDR26DRAFT_934024 [Obelidium mucronatum]
MNIGAPSPVQSIVFTAAVAGPAPPPAIAAGAATLQDLAAATEYHSEVKRRKLCIPPLATAADEGAAMVYCTEVALDQSRGLQNVLAAALAAALPNALAQALPAALAPIHVRLNTIDAHLNTIDAHLVNQRARHLNVRISTTAFPHAPVYLLVKESSGHGPAGVIPADPALVALPAPVPVGSAFPAAAAFRPASFAAIMNLTMQQIRDLEWFYGVMFASGALVSEKRISVWEYFT